MILRARPLPAASLPLALVRGFAWGRSLRHEAGPGTRARPGSATRTSRRTATAASTCCTTTSATATPSTPVGSRAGPGSTCARPRSCPASTSTSCCRSSRSRSTAGGAPFQQTGDHELRITPGARSRRHRVPRLGAVRRRTGRRAVARREQLAGRRQRGRDHERAAHGDVVVPGQRPPARQGVVRHPDHGAAGERGGRERRPGRTQAARPGHRALAGGRADGALPRLLRGRYFETRSASCNGITNYVAVSKQPAVFAAASGQDTGRPDLRDRHRALERARPLPLRRHGGRGDRPARWASRWRTRPGRPTRLGGLDAGAGGARARPPVVRRLGVGHQLARHLAQRGLRRVPGEPLLHRVLGGRSMQPGSSTTYDSFVDDPSGCSSIDDPGSAPRCSTRGSTSGARWRMQALRNRVGDVDFFTLLRTWVSDRRLGNGSRRGLPGARGKSVSGEDLDGVLPRLAARPRSRPAHLPAERSGLTSSRGAGPTGRSHAFEPSNSEMSTATTRSPRPRTAAGSGARRSTSAPSRSRAAPHARRPPPGPRGTRGRPPGRRRGARSRSRCRRAAR